MKSINSRLAAPAAALLAAGVCLTTTATLAQDVQHLSVPVPGGWPGVPMITGIERQSNHVTVTWAGPAGYYQLFEKPSMTDPRWLPLGGPTNLSWHATIPATYSNAVFRVSGPAGVYAGSRACAECHPGLYQSLQQTAHPHAYQTLQQSHQQTNPDCLSCHTTGYSSPTGFTLTNSTRASALAGVQCEDCHGPAAYHAANPEDPLLRPRVELAAALCGGCHTWSQAPTYNEWAASQHAGVTEPNMNPNTCGRCHIGPARLAMLGGIAPSTNDTHLGVVCAVCHLSHQVQAHTNILYGAFTFTNKLTGTAITFTNHQLGWTYTNQLRNPVASVQNYSLSTSDVFTDKYDPTVNICAQCHNDRGASYTISSRPPHPSLQYNMLIGTVGELPNVTAPHYPSTHSHIEQQCVSCHMQSATNDVTGHKFDVESYQVCIQCHGDDAIPQKLVAFVQDAITNQVQNLKAALDLWATTHAPEALRTKYGALAWEYTSPGSLSTGGAGPSSSEQALIPVTIQKARFNLYLVWNDGSFGVHNGPYAIALLNAARDWVRQALQP